MHMATSILVMCGQPLLRKSQPLSSHGGSAGTELGSADLVASCQKDGDCQHREAKGRTDVGCQGAQGTLLESASGFKASCRDMNPGLHIAKALRGEDRCRAC